MGILPGKKGGEQPEEPRRDLYEVVARMVLGLMLNFVAKKIKKKSQLKKERKRAQVQIEKLAKKGKDIPEDLEEQATAGLSRHDKKKLARKGKKKLARKGKKKKSKTRKLALALALIVAVAVLASRAAKK